MKEEQRMDEVAVTLSIVEHSESEVGNFSFAAHRCSIYVLPPSSTDMLTCTTVRREVKPWA